MAAPMPLRQAIWQFKFSLAKLLLGSKPRSAHFAWVGAGSASQLCRQIAEAGHRRVLVVTDGPLFDLGIAQTATEGFTGTDVSLHWFTGVQPDPGFKQVAAGATLLREHRCTAVLAVGGGSSIDAAKVIAACGDPAANPMDWVGMNKLPDSVAPIFAIPTTAGTGSEATQGAVITDESDHSKQVIVGDALLPKAVALDASLMLGLPPAVTAATGLDALTHGVEAFIGPWERGTRSEAAASAVSGVFRWLPRVLAEPEDLEARQGMVSAAYYGGVAINQVNVGNVHAIAHQLGAQYGIPHGVANALVLPHVLRTYGGAAAGRLDQLARTLDDPAITTAPALIEAIVALRDASGLPAVHEAIQHSDIATLREAAIAEGDGYFSPRLLEVGEVESTLAALIK